MYSNFTFFILGLLVISDGFAYAVGNEGMQHKSANSLNGVQKRIPDFKVARRMQESAEHDGPRSVMVDYIE